MKNQIFLFLVIVIIGFELIRKSHSTQLPIHTHDYCNVQDLQKYCPSCPRACGVNTCGCTCPITTESILPRPANPSRPAYCQSCPICLQLPKIKCANPLPLCTANIIRDLIAF